MGHAYADEYIPADYSDKEAILQLVKEHNIDKIVSCANDFGVLTAAYVAERWAGRDMIHMRMLSFYTTRISLKIIVIHTIFHHLILLCLPI